MRVLIHIGTLKTASTFLQREYFQKHPQLKFHDLSASIEPVDYTWNTLNPAEGIPNVISDERFASTRARITSDGLNALSGAETLEYQDRTASSLRSHWPDAQILFVTRNFREFFASLYCQYVKSGGFLDAKDFAERYEDTFQALADFDRIIEIYTSLFDEKNLLVLPYELLVVDMNDFLRRVERFAQIEMFNPQPARVNVRWSPRETVGARRMSRLIASCCRLLGGQRGTDAFRRYYRNLASGRMRNLCAVMGICAPTKTVFDAETARVVPQLPIPRVVFRADYARVRSFYE
jgi:hypothetical protein